MKRRAEIAGLCWALTDEHALLMMSSNCNYCDAPPSNVSSAGCSRTGSFAYSGIDRVDNSRGYEPDNVVPCCIDCNRAKRTRTRADFLAWAERLYAHSVRGRS